MSNRASIERNSDSKRLVPKEAKPYIPDQYPRNVKTTAPPNSDDLLLQIPEDHGPRNRSTVQRNNNKLDNSEINSVDSVDRNDSDSVNDLEKSFTRLNLKSTSSVEQNTTHVSPASKAQKGTSSVERNKTSPDSLLELTRSLLESKKVIFVGEAPDPLATGIIEENWPGNVHTTLYKDLKIKRKDTEEIIEKLIKDDKFHCSINALNHDYSKFNAVFWLCPWYDTKVNIRGKVEDLLLNFCVHVYKYENVKYIALMICDNEHNYYKEYGFNGDNSIGQFKWVSDDREFPKFLIQNKYKHYTASGGDIHDNIQDNLVLRILERE